MDLFFLFFQAAPAIQMIFKISYIPKKEDFKELTDGQYQAMYAKMSEEDLKALSNKKVYAFLPDDIQAYNRLVNVYGNDLLVVDDNEISVFEKVASLIGQYCADSGRSFNSVPDILSYMAQMLPDAFSEGTPYEIHATLRKSGKPRK